MNLLKLLPEVEIAVASAQATASKYVYFWFTGYVPCIAMDAAIGTLKVRNCLGNVEVTPVAQFAAVRSDKPTAPVVVAGFTPLTADDEKVVTFSMASAPTNTYVRFGIGVRVTSAGTGTADVAMQVSYGQLGRLLAPWSGHLIAYSALPVYTPITGWIPALWLSAVVATIGISDRAGNHSLDIVYRTADTSPEQPNAWSSGILSAALVANDETNSGECAVTLTGKMWVQIGAATALTSGTTLGQADVTVLLGIRQAT